MQIPLTYYDLPLRTIQRAVDEALSIVNDLAKHGVVDEDLEYMVSLHWKVSRWVEEHVRAAVARTQTRKSGTRTRRGGSRRTDPAPLQHSKRANG